MFSHVMIGCNDLTRLAAFYDVVLGPLGLVQRATVEDGGPLGACWVRPAEQLPRFYVQGPFNRLRASPGNGVMVAFLALDHDSVDRAHVAGLQAGGTDEGAGTPRPLRRGLLRLLSARPRGEQAASGLSWRPLLAASPRPGKLNWGAWGGRTRRSHATLRGVVSRALGITKPCYRSLRPKPTRSRRHGHPQAAAAPDRHRRRRGRIIHRTHRRADVGRARHGAPCPRR